MFKQLKNGALYESRRMSNQTNELNVKPEELHYLNIMFKRVNKYKCAKKKKKTLKSVKNECS